MSSRHHGNTMGLWASWPGTSGAPVQVPHGDPQPGRRNTLLVGVALVLAVTAPPGIVLAEEGLGATFVLLHGEETDADLEQMRKQLGAILVDEDVLYEHRVEILADLWAESTVQVTAGDVDVCAGKPVSADAVARQAHEAFQAAVKGSFDAAVRKAESVEASLECVRGPVVAVTLQQVALARAWAAMNSGDSDTVVSATKQTAAVGRRIPPDLREVMPESLTLLFAESASDLDHAAQGQIMVTARGTPVDVLVDGREVGLRVGTGGTDLVVIDVDQGDHVLQVGTVAEDLVTYRVHVAEELVSLEVINAVSPVTVLQMFEEVFSDHVEPRGLLAGMLDEHSLTSKADTIVFGASRDRFGEKKYEIVALVREADGFAIDEGFTGRMSAMVDTRSAEAESGALRSRDEGSQFEPPGHWWLRAGGGVGVAVVAGRPYLAPSVELALETPIYLGVDMRGEVALHRDVVEYETSTRVQSLATTYALGGGTGLVTFSPHFKRLRLMAGIGATARGPDYRFEGVRVHPTAAMGASVRLGRGLFIGVDAAFTLHPVRDVTIRFTVVRGFRLDGTKKSGSSQDIE